MDDMGLDLHFLSQFEKENICSHQFLNWWQQGSTGALHLDGFESYVHTNKKDHPSGWSFLFGGRYRTRTYDLPHVKRML